MWKKWCRYANEQSRKSKHVKHVHTSRARHKRAACYIIVIYFSSLCIAVKRREYRERGETRGISCPKVVQTFPTPGIPVTAIFAQIRRDLADDRDPDRSRDIPGVPSISSWRAAAALLDTLRVSPRSSFPDVLSRGSSSFQSVAARAHSRLRYRARALLRSDPWAGSGERRTWTWTRARARAPRVARATFDEGRRNRKWSIENGSCLGNHDLL